jgi:hypothetical protein
MIKTPVMPLYDKYLDRVIEELHKTGAESYRDYLTRTDSEKMHLILQAIQIMITLAFAADNSPQAVASAIEYVLWEEAKEGFYNDQIVH